MYRLFLIPILVCLTVPPAKAIDYPGTEPGVATGAISSDRAFVANKVIRCEWRRRAGRLDALTVTNRQNGQTLRLFGGHMPRLVMGTGRTVDLAEMVPIEPVGLEAIDGGEGNPKLERRSAGKRLVATFRDELSDLTIDWSVELRDGSNYVVQTIELKAKRSTKIDSLVFVDAKMPDATQVGKVAGSVVVCRQIFLAVENPLAENVVAQEAHVRCKLPRGNTIRPDHPWRNSSVIGVVPEGQLRRGFLYYLERRRAHPYRPYLHYNSWYHLNLERPDYHMTEAECLATIEQIGQKLVEQRGVKIDAFVWDDGWDDFNSLWDFHKDFPNGFKRLKAAAAPYGSAQGVWMSPWGGYSEPGEKRIAYGQSQGYEVNGNRFSMAGTKYQTAFRDMCLTMMKHHGVEFFKFDGMGQGVDASGATNESADDIDAVLRLTHVLRRKKPNVFISATTGTWASPFWTLYADSIWRQGGDTGFAGVGNRREQWITYRDMHAYRRVVQLGPLYPLNSLMFHGLCIGDRGKPAEMPLDETSVAHEIWTIFGCGTGLQELYISPYLLTETMWDTLAEAAKWSRANADVIVDSHWVGGDPGALQVYGFASWSSRIGIVVLRNPSEKPQSFKFIPQQVWELRQDVQDEFTLRQINAVEQNSQSRHVRTNGSLNLTLQPFEVIVLEGTVDR